MIPTVSTVDAWRASCRRSLDEACAAALALVDVGLVATPPRVRTPSRAERDATDRADGRFEPTPAGSRRSSGTSDPTLAAVMRWETAVERRVTAFFEAVSAATAVAASLAIDVRDEHGRPLPPPAEPSVRHATDGRVVVEANPAACRRHLYAATVFLGAVVDALADRLLATDDPDAVVGTAHALRDTLDRLAPRPDPVPLCACGCRRPLGSSRRPIRDACQKRRERQRTRKDDA